MYQCGTLIPIRMSCVDFRFSLSFIDSIIGIFFLSLKTTKIEGSDAEYKILQLKIENLLELNEHQITSRMCIKNSRMAALACRKIHHDRVPSDTLGCHIKTKKIFFCSHFLQQSSDIYTHKNKVENHRYTKYLLECVTYTKYYVPGVRKRRNCERKIKLCSFCALCMQKKSSLPAEEKKKMWKF